MSYHPFTVPDTSILIFVLEEGIRTVLFSGSILSVIGLLMAGINLYCRNKYGLILGLSAPLISLLCFVVIRAYQVGPYDAQKPMEYVSIIYIVLSTGLTFLSIKSFLNKSKNEGD